MARPEHLAAPAVDLEEIARDFRAVVLDENMPEDERAARISSLKDELRDLADRL